MFCLCKHTAMLGLEFTYIFIVLAILHRPFGCSGQENKICYIKKNQQQTAFCGEQNTEKCCNQHLSVDNIAVYGRKMCESLAHCGSGDECCASRDILNVSGEYLNSLERTFRRTNCFKDVTILQLPANKALVSVAVTYSCTATSTSTTATTTIPGGTPTATTMPSTASTTTATTGTLATDNSSAILPKTNDEIETDVSDSKASVAASVAIPVVIVFIIAGILAAVFFIRRRRAANKETHRPGVESNTLSYNGPLQKSFLDNRQHSDLPPSYDEDINSEYAEIEGNRNSNLFGESNEYNTISPRHLPVTNGQIPAGQQATNEDYDHIGVQSPGHSKGTDTYAHIDHSAAKRLNVSNGGVVTDTSMYAHSAHNVQSGHGADTVDVGGDTYAHVDHGGKQRQTENTRFNGGDTYAHANHGALQEHDRNRNSNTYDSTSTSGVDREGGQYASEESQYDHTDHNALTGSLGQYQDGGDYSHVGTISTSRQREDDRTVTNVQQIQNPVSGTKKQNDQNSDQHSYFVLDKQFK